MGQAKQRGTRQQRAAAAIERNAKNRAEREVREQARIAVMTPAERARQRRLRYNLAIMEALLLGEG